MGKSSGSVLELKLMNCKGLQAFNFFQKLSVYAVVSFTSDVDPNKKQQKQRTPTDNQEDKDPEWNHEMRFNLEEDSDFLHFDLRSELALFGDKSLGEVRVLLKDLMDEEEESNGIVRFVSYEVRTSDRKPNGILNFSYRLRLKNQHKEDQGATGGGEICNLGVSSSSPINMDDGHTHMDGYPILDIHHDHDQDHQYQPHPHQHNNNNNNGDDECYYSAMAIAPHHQIHYPSLAMPPYPAPGESYTINYPHPHDALFHSQPPPLPLPPVLPLLPPKPFPPPPPPPPPPHHHHYPPPPPPHHHHHYPPPPPPHHHHYPPPPPPHHIGEGAVYPPPLSSPSPSPSPWVYAQSYPDHEAPNPLEFPDDYACPCRLHSSYYMGDPTHHSR